MFTKVLVVVMSVTMAACQRPSFAGSRPIGFPEVIKTTTDGLENKFGESDTTTVRLPLEAKGDKDLVDRLSKLPIDQQPFWFINWQAYEAHRQKPQTYPQKPNVFIDPTSNNMNINPNTMNSNVNNMPSFYPANQQTTQLPQSGNINNDLNNRNLDSSDSLVPTQKIDTQPPSKAPSISIDNNKPPEYIMVNGVLYKIADNQSAPK